MNARLRTHLPILAITVAGVGWAVHACYLVDNPEYIEHPSGSNVLLRVTTPDGEAVPLATVTVAGTTALTDSAGFAHFQDLPDGRFVARIDAPGHTSAVVATEVSDGMSGFEQPRLFDLGERHSFDTEKVATIVTDDVRVDIAPGTLRDQNGDVVTGMADATIVFIDPTAEGGLDNLPGPLESKNHNNKHAVLRSIAMADISLWQGDERLHLAEGAHARIQLKIPDGTADKVQVGDEFSAWYLDLDEGLWIEDGVGVVELDENSNKVWIAEVSHFTIWNCDREIQWSESQCFVAQVIVDVMAADGTTSKQTLADVGVEITDNSLGAYKDHATTLLTDQNRQSNCVVFEMGTAPTVNVDTYSIPLADLPSYQTNGVGTGSCSANPEDDDYDENKANAACTSLIIELPLAQGFTKVCEPGSSRKCVGSYTGPSGTEDVGICHGDMQYCIEGGLKWSDCGGQVTPQTETCTTVNIDDDCDGKTTDYSDGSSCTCTKIGQTAPCYTGPSGTKGVGACKAGTKTCESVSGTLVYGACMNDIVPTAEDCSTTDPTIASQDENCDSIPQCTGDSKPSKFHNATINDMVVSASGDIYALGYFTDTLIYDSKPLAEPIGDSSQNTLLMKLDPNGNLIWAKNFGGTGDDYGRGIAASPSGGVVITGSFQGSMQFRTLVTNPIGGTTARGAIYVAKIDADGTPVWSNVYGQANDTPSGDSIGYDVAIDDATGDIYVTGVVYGNALLMPAQGSDVFVLALHDAGDQKWAQVYTAANVERASGIAIGPQGNLFITGYFYDTIDFGGSTAGPRTTNGSHDVFIARISSVTGAALKSTSFGSIKSDTASGIAINSVGTVFVTGSFRDTITIADTHLVPMTSTEIDYSFVAAFEPTELAAQWSKGYVGNSAADDFGVAIGVDSRDYVVFTGQFDGLSSFGGTGGPLDPTGNRGIYLVKLKSNGDHLWTSYPGNGIVRSLAIADDGRIYLGGAGLVHVSIP